MPMKPKRPCRMTRCKKYAVDGNCYCSEHKRQMERWYEHYQRGYKTSARYDKEWRLARDRYIEAHPLCEMCLAEGFAKTAELVHHKIPISRWLQDNDIERAAKSPHIASNLMSLCRSHHAKVHGDLGDRVER